MQGSTLNIVVNLQVVQNKFVNLFQLKKMFFSIVTGRNFKRSCFSQGIFVNARDHSEQNDSNMFLGRHMSYSEGLPYFFPLKNRLICLFA